MTMKAIKNVIKEAGDLLAEIEAEQAHEGGDHEGIKRNCDDELEVC